MMQNIHEADQSFFSWWMDVMKDADVKGIVIVKKRNSAPLDPEYEKKIAEEMEELYNQRKKCQTKK
jgi:hypothetical protein